MSFTVLIFFAAYATSSKIVFDLIHLPFVIVFVASAGAQSTGFSIDRIESVICAKSIVFTSSDARW